MENPAETTIDFLEFLSRQPVSQGTVFYLASIVSVLTWWDVRGWFFFDENCWSRVAARTDPVEATQNIICVVLLFDARREIFEFVAVSDQT